MPPEAPVLTSLGDALVRFAFPDSSVQTSRHILALHWYVACRMVIEGGFDPDRIRPRPPITVERTRSGIFLHHDPGAAKAGERDDTRRPEDETAGRDGDGSDDRPRAGGVTQGQPQRVPQPNQPHGGGPPGTAPTSTWPIPRWSTPFGTCCVRTKPTIPPRRLISASRTVGTTPQDVAVLPGGGLAEPIRRYRRALERLSDRGDLRDHPSRYEACGLTLVRSRGGPAVCGVYPGQPPAESVLDYNRMFRRLYAIYDIRFVYDAPALRSRTEREVWDRESPLLADAVSRDEAFAEMEARVG